MTRIILGIVLVFCAVVSGQTEYGDMLLPAGAFLWLPTDAATDALGGAATAEGGRTSAGWANPATLFSGGDFSAGATYTYSRYKTFNSGAFATKRIGNWAGAARFFLMDSGDIEARSGPTTEPDYTFTSHQLYLQFAGARRITDFMALGTSAKWVHERIDQDTRDGWIFDFGIAGNYKFMKAGIAIKNWGAEEVAFKIYQERYPITYRAGLAAKVLDYGTIRADWVKPDKLGGWLAIGAEWNANSLLTVRAGYTPGHDTRNISGGIGTKYCNFNLDYALVNYSEGLGISHQVTLTYAPSE